MRTLYSLAIHCYHFFLKAASLFNPKAKLWVEGRKDIFQKLSSKISDLQSSGSPLIWFHCASLGEFEQGRPLIERYKELHPRSIILLTFFSPSGYEIRKNYSGADIVCYLPTDTKSNAKQFIDIVKPSAVFFVKYEFWFNYLAELKNRNVPVYLVSGIFRREQHFFRPYGTWFRKQLQAFSHFYLQDETSTQLLHSIGYRNTTVAGDTRFDRVAEIAKNVKTFPLIAMFRGEGKVCIAGSSWKEDEEIIAGSGSPQFKWIIVPHEVDEPHLASIEARFAGSLRYSRANEQNAGQAQVLIIDNIGMLSSLYQYGQIAFIGGGFGKGIHNILEAAAFGLPVIFGPNYQKFAEAKELIRLGGAFSISDKNEFGKIMTLLQDEQVLKTASYSSKHYVQSRTGASEKILDRMSKN